MTIRKIHSGDKVLPKDDIYLLPEHNLNKLTKCELITLSDLLDGALIIKYENDRPGPFKVAGFEPVVTASTMVHA